MYNDKMSAATHPSWTEDPDGKESEIDLSIIKNAIKHHRRIVILFSLIPAILAGSIAFLVGPTYTAEAAFLPPSSGSGASALSSALLGQLGGNMASSALGGIKDPTLIYIGILGSRSVSDAIIQRFDLSTVYHKKKLSLTELALKQHAKFVSGKNSITTISVDDKNPKRAADIANAYLEELHKANNRLALTESAQRRRFFEEQVEKEKNALADAEVDLATTQQQTGLIQPAGQTLLQMQSIAQTQAQIAARQVELASLMQGATEQNPEVVRLRSEVSGLQAELNRLQNSKSTAQSGNIQIPTAKVPELGLLYLRKARNLKYHEELYQLLLRQYVSAELDESRSSPLLQVLDYAVVPDRKSGPHIGLIILGTLFVGMIAGCVRAIALERQSLQGRTSSQHVLAVSGSEKPLR
jgi:uncharacterized protein involved in exopolysaccharide biosynthesis